MCLWLSYDLSEADQIVDYEFPAWDIKEVIKGFGYFLIKYLY